MNTPNKEQVTETLRGFLAEQLAINHELVTENARWSDLGADSLDCVELIMSAEEEYNILIEDATAEEWETFGQAVDGICALLERGAK